jgi:integrase
VRWAEPDGLPEGKREIKWIVGRWVRDERGEYHRVEGQGETKTAATRALEANIKRRVSSGPQDINGDSTVNQLLDRWLERRQSRTELSSEDPDYLEDTTSDRDTTVINVHIRPELGELRLREVTTERIDRLIEGVKKGTNRRSVAASGYWAGQGPRPRKTLTEPAAKGAPSQAPHVRRILKSAFTLARRYSAVPANPVLDTEPVKTTSRKGFVPEPGAAREAIKRLRQWDQGLTLDSETGQWVKATGRPRVGGLADVGVVLVATGGRIGEVLALEWDDIEFTGDSSAKITFAAHLVDAKGKPTRRVEHRKQGSAPVIVTVGPAATRLLRRQQAQWASLPNPLNLVFPSATLGIRPPASFRRQWRAALRGSGFEAVDRHAMRRGVATLLSETFDAEAAREQLGQANVAVTKKHYIKDSNEAADRSTTLEVFFEGMDDEALVSSPQPSAIESGD